VCCYIAIKWTVLNWITDRVGVLMMGNRLPVSAARWQLAGLVPDMFCNFYLVKNDKIADNSVTTRARVFLLDIFGILRILEKF